MDELIIFTQLCWKRYKTHWISYTISLACLVAPIYLIQSSVESSEYHKEKKANYATSPAEFMPVEKLNATVGDLLECKRAFGLYDHWGVYVGNGDVIHLVPNPDGHNKDQIRKDSIAEFAHGSECRINNQESAASRRHLQAKSNQEIKLAAFKHLDDYNSGIWLRDNEYSLLTFNCEHFATYCRYGTPFSEMVNILDGKSNLGVVAKVLDTVVDMDISLNSSFVINKI